MSQSPRKVLLVGWDGADWKVASPLMDAGAMPQFANLVEHGISGNLASQPPYLSPMLWNSIATGKRPHKHGILGFTSTDPQTGKLRPMASTQRRCKALWNILSEHGKVAHVVGWFASHPAENINGVCVSEAWPRPVAKGAPWPIPANAITPAEVADELADLRVRPEDVDLGILRLFIPRLDEIDLSRDKRPEQLLIRLAELYTVHNAAIELLDRGPWDCLAVYYHFIDWVCHDFMDFHPPRRPHIPEREYGWYSEVINSAYRLQDLLLADLLKHAGPGVTAIVCSDHGFHSDHHRPLRTPRVTAGIAGWHRPQGLLAAAGPGIARDKLLAGASQLDVTPTILHLFGLPHAEDMDGRVLTELLDPTPARAPRTIPSWETAAVPHPRARHTTDLGEDESAALLQQFADLGYVELNTNGPESAVEVSDRENRWNLAITLRNAGLDAEALPLFEELHFAFPEEPRYAYHLALTCIALGLLDEAAIPVETILDYGEDNPKARTILAEIAQARNEPEVALAHLDAAARLSPDRPARARLRGLVLLKLERWSEAAESFHLALEHDPDDDAAWLGLARAFIRAGQFAEAAEYARNALGLNSARPLAAFTLGQALAAAEQPQEAAEAFRRALAIRPGFKAAQNALDRLQGKPYVADTLFPETDDPAPRRERSSAHLADLLSRRNELRTKAKPVSSYSPPQKTKPPEPGASGKTFTLVSGLPRSGTSLMMQMLVRGGLPPMTDGHRTADPHNPEGYFEWEAIRELPRNPDILLQAEGKVTKIVCPLLPHLPVQHRYEIVFMRRPAEQVAASQSKMRRALTAVGDDEAVPPELLARHEEAILTALRQAPNIRLLEVDYPQLVAAPEATVVALTDFLGNAKLPDSRSMAGAVRPDLHREKGAASAR